METLRFLPVGREWSPGVECKVRRDRSVELLRKIAKVVCDYMRSKRFARVQLHSLIYEVRMAMETTAESVRDFFVRQTADAKESRGSLPRSVNGVVYLDTEYAQPIEGMPVTFDFSLDDYMDVYYRPGYAWREDQWQVKLHESLESWSEYFHLYTDDVYQKMLPEPRMFHERPEEDEEGMDPVNARIARTAAWGRAKRPDAMHRDASKLTANEAVAVLDEAIRTYDAARAVAVLRAHKTRPSGALVTLVEVITATARKAPDDVERDASLIVITAEVLHSVLDDWDAKQKKARNYREAQIATAPMLREVREAASVLATSSAKTRAILFAREAMKRMEEKMTNA